MTTTDDELRKLATGVIAAPSPPNFGEEETTLTERILAEDVLALLARAQAAEAAVTRLQILGSELINELDSDPMRLHNASARAVGIQERLEEAEARVAKLDALLDRRDERLEREFDKRLEGVRKRDQTIADLLTLVDFCNSCAIRLASSWSVDPETEYEAIQDAHDMARVLMGGDKTRYWANTKEVLADDSSWAKEPSQWVKNAGPDVRLRMRELLARLEARG